MRKQITSFYLESLLLIVIFTAILLILLGVFSGAKAQSVRAEQLTKAVIMAENAAEAVAASDSMEDLQALLAGAESMRLDGNVLSLFDQGYELDIRVIPDGAMRYATIRVSRGGEELYTLETADYTAEVAG